LDHGLILRRARIAGSDSARVRAVPEAQAGLGEGRRIVGAIYELRTGRVRFL
jgi:hypothetical protein